jgi:hypothetical protein
MWSRLSAAKERLRKGATITDLTESEWNAIEVMEPSTAKTLHREQREKIDRAAADLQQRAKELRELLTAEDIPSPEIARLTAHAIQLCLDHRIRAILNTHEGVAGYADQSTRTIALRPIISEVDYAIALHEIGHVLEPRRESGFVKAINGRAYSDHPMSELAAWRWACRNAVTWTRKMHDRVRYRLAEQARTYRDHSDGDGDCSSFVACIRESAARICDRPLTFEELEADAACVDVESAPAAEVDRASLIADVETRVKELLTNGG